MVKLLRKAGLPCLLSVCLFLSGCGLGSVKLSDPYSFEQRPITVADDSDTSGYAKAFASDLCVVGDESRFNAGDVTSEAGALFDVTDDTVLYSKNAFERLYPASITKVMTALIAIKYGNLKDKVTVTDDAVITEPGASLCGIKPGDTLTMEQLLYGLLLPSGNDAAAAIAVHMSGGVEAFAARMNEEAKKLGATGTHFVNPHGLHDDDHYTTAYDLYLIFNEALKYPEFKTVTSQTAYAANYTDKDGNRVSQTWKGSNLYMTGSRSTPDGLTVFSGKTGTTQKAGYCLIMAEKDKENKEYISVVLKAGSRQGLYDNMTNIMNKIVD